MFAMFNSDADLSYKTINVYSKDKDQVFFISDLPHLVKTIRNCFARGKLWVCLGLNYVWIIELCDLDNISITN